MIKSLLHRVLQILVSIALFIVIRAFVVEMFKIPTPSMQNTLLAGDFLIVEKMQFGGTVPLTNWRLPGFRKPEAGDIMVFRWPPNPELNFVKRVVGISNDTLSMQEGVLFRNGERVLESYAIHYSPETDPFTDAFTWQRDYLVASLHASRSYWPSRNNWGPLIVPKDHYFVLGDNRDNSLDSRYWGFVPDSLVRGRPLIVLFSVKPDTSSAVPQLDKIRWERLGTIVR